MSLSIMVTLRNGTAQAIGNDGERLLVKDLGVSNNNRTNELQCVCNSSRYSEQPPGQCNICFASSSYVSNFRIPDFVTNQYVVESKNAQRLRHRQANGILTRDFSQISEIARTIDRPLWVYVRMDTIVDDVFYDIVEPTGGGIVPYFVYAGYVDPIDQAAQAGLGVSVLVIVLIGLWEIRERRNKEVIVPIVPPKPRPKPSDPYDEFNDLTERTRRRIDDEDAKHEQ